MMQTRYANPRGGNAAGAVALGGAPQPAVRRGFQFHGRGGVDQVGTAGTGPDGSFIPSNQMRANCMPRSDISMPPDRAYRAGPTARNRS